MVLDKVKLEYETEHKSKHSEGSQIHRILSLLKANGSATNRELNQICYRYSARIENLRNEGHIIVSNRLDGGLWSYVYKGEK